jgi:hypothetical protein
MLKGPKESVLSRGTTVNRSKQYVVLAVATAIMCLGMRAWADSAVGGIDWESAEGPWTNEYGWTEIEALGSGGSSGGGFLSVTFPATAEPGPETEWVDIIHTSATNLFTGTWTTDQWIEFDFWASNATPTKLQVQWKSSTNDNIWGFALTPPAEGSWTTMDRASFQNWTDWQYPGASAEQFVSDLATIDWIGIYIQREGQGLEDYGIDNFNLMVPEPAEVCMLIAAALCAGLALWRRRRRFGTSTG